MSPKLTNIYITFLLLLHFSKLLLEGNAFSEFSNYNIILDKMNQFLVSKSTSELSNIIYSLWGPRGVGQYTTYIKSKGITP